MSWYFAQVRCKVRSNSNRCFNIQYFILALLIWRLPFTVMLVASRICTSTTIHPGLQDSLRLKMLRTHRQIMLWTHLQCSLRLLPCCYPGNVYSVSAAWRMMMILILNNFVCGDFGDIDSWYVHSCVPLWKRARFQYHAQWKESQHGAWWSRHCKMGWPHQHERWSSWNWP